MITLLGYIYIGGYPPLLYLDVRLDARGQDNVPIGNKVQPCWQSRNIDLFSCF